MPDLNVSVAFRRVASRDGLVVHIGVVNGAISGDGDGWIGAVALRVAAGNNKLIPNRTRICTQRSALRSAALIDRQPGCAIRGYVKMAGMIDEVAVTARPLVEEKGNRLEIRCRPQHDSEMADCPADLRRREP